MIAPAGQSTARACLRSKLAALVVRRQAGPATWGLHAPKTPNKEVGRPTGYANAVLLSVLNAIGPSSTFESGVPPNPRRGEVEAPLSKGAGRVSGLGDSDGLCVAAHSRATSAREKGPGCRPPSPLSSATRLRQSVGAGHARPAALPLPPRILCIVGRGLDPSAGRRGRRPLQHNPQGFSLPQTSAAAWGQAALHPTLPHSVGRAFARNSFTPPCRGRACPARSLAITTPVSFAS